jgi:nucleotidyltransferase substrate binding protein (TIGR01987 family)
LIQRFEFTFELAWKTIQDFIESIGYVNIKGPRNVIKQMVNDGFIEEKIWQDMIEARNELSHLYDEKLSREYAEKIVNHFITGFKDLENFLLKNVDWKK